MFFTIFLIFFRAYFFVGLFLLLCFQRSSFCTWRARFGGAEFSYFRSCLQNFQFLYQIPPRALLGRVFLGCSFFPFITLKILCHSPSTPEFQLKNQLITLWEFPYMLFVTFPLLFLIFYLLIFVSLITVCLGVSSSLGLFPAWDPLCFLSWLTVSFTMFGEVFTYL